MTPRSLHKQMYIPKAKVSSPLFTVSSIALITGLVGMPVNVNMKAIMRRKK
jgi:hypothetical protein